LRFSTRQLVLPVSMMSRRLPRAKKGSLLFVNKKKQKNFIL